MKRKAVTDSIFFFVYYEAYPPEDAVRFRESSVKKSGIGFGSIDAAYQGGFIVKTAPPPSGNFEREVFG